MRVYQVTDLGKYTEYFPKKKEAMKVARERSVDGKWHGVVRFELGKLTKAKMIAILNGDIPCESFERIWQLDPADDRIVD